MHQVWPYNVGREINAWTELNLANSSVPFFFYGHSLLYSFHTVSCKFVTNLFLFTGLFNLCDKVLVAFEILLEWREYFKRGVPISSAIESKLQSWTKQLTEVWNFIQQPTFGILCVALFVRAQADLSKTNLIFS